MASHFAARSAPIHFPFLSPTIPTTTCRSPSFLPLFSTQTPTPRLHHHGPSLPKIPSPPPPPLPSSSSFPPVLPRDLLTRAYDLSALRVPAERCASLESRLRGHLLNWPRIRNIARVPGDDVDPEVLELLRREGSDEGAGAGWPLSPVVYREKLAKEFNCRGFVKFRNLARMSRPRRRKRKKGGEEMEKGGEGRERRGRRAFAVVELVEEEEEEEGLGGLLGDGFRGGGGAWRGSTRLLLLDERYAKKGMEELPEAVKGVLLGDAKGGRSFISELVQCRLILSYDYWSMNEILDALLPEGMVVPTAFETVGHIAHLNLKEEHLPYKKIIAQVVLDKNKPKISTVVNKIDAIQNEFRTMQLGVLAGNHSLVTTVMENGIRFYVDLAKVYWNSRLATERQRLIYNFSSSDVVCDVFAGVGPIAIFAAKKVKYVYANDLNPNAVDYLERNIVLNKLDRKIEVFNMDGRRFISSMFASQRPHSITQVVMNLPNDAAEFLGAFRGILCRTPNGAGPVLPKIHVYGFSKSNNPEFDFHERIKVALCVSMVDIEIQRVRLVAPGKWMLCGSFILPKKVAFAWSDDFYRLEVLTVLNLRVLLRTRQIGNAFWQ